MGAQMAVGQAQHREHASGHSRPVQLYLDGAKVAEAIFDELREVGERRGLRVFAA